MTVYYEKARELGELILQSDKAALLNEARKAFDAEPSAKVKLDEYSKYQKDVQESAAKGVMTQEEFNIATQRMAEMVSELKKDAVIGALIFAENEFGSFVNNVLNVLKATITGEMPAEESCSGCSGSEGGCSSCGCN